MKMRMSNTCLCLFLFLSLLLLHSTAVHFVPNPSFPPPQRLSHRDECNALLQFSNSLIISRNASFLHCDVFQSMDYAGATMYEYFLHMNTKKAWVSKNINSYPKTASWKNDTDCCSWDGVTCHPATNEVIGLDLSCSWLRGPLSPNSTLFSLPNLRRLNLSGNNFQGSRVSPRFGIFEGMTHLNLSYSDFSGPIPLEMSHLSSLMTLDLSGIGSDVVTEDHEFRKLLQNLTQLREFALDCGNISGISPISLTNLSSTLKSLQIVDCGLQGTFPIDIFRLPNLVSLALSANDELTGTLPGTNWTSRIISLDLQATNFYGLIPASLGNMTSMISLDLSYSAFTGPIPPTLGNLDRLTQLSLSNNNLNGTVDLEMFARLRNLQYLELGQNNLTVLLQSSGNCSFPRLQYLALSHSNLTVFPYFLSSSEELSYLDLSGNMISGRIPQWFSGTRRETLTYLDLSSNNFTGEIPSAICQVSSLNFFNLSNNSLNGSIPRCLGNLRDLFALYLGNNLLQGALPQSLVNCANLQELSVGFNRIYDTFPRWLNATHQLVRLDLQSNKFHGAIEIPLPPRLLLLMLSNNNFEGPLPIPPLTIAGYLVSSNIFRGDIPHQICDATMLNVIDLSNNSLIGSIPHCLVNSSSYLSVLDLRANNFVGQIPETFAPGNNLRTIRLSQNQLGGLLPRSLAHSKNLEVLDLSENKLEGSFPYWLETLPNLRVLNLRSNKFHGPVHMSKRTRRPFRNLRIFDLSINSFWGPLPATYIANLVAMKKVNRSGLQYMSNDGSFYQVSIMVVMKGSEFELVKILTTFTTIDFSSNMFEGEIPEVIGDLRALKGLNFSHNNLSSSIPSSMGNLAELEWLDLSSNKLAGEIPRGLADLTFLACLNLSDNQLTGQIPRGPQFDTFNHSFDGNPGLCGHPLPKACESDAGQTVPSAAHEERETKSNNWIEWRAVPMGFGCGLVFGISAGYVMLEIKRPQWLVRIVEWKRWGRIN